MKKNLVPVLVVLLLVFVVGAAGIVTHLIRKYTPTKDIMDPAEYYGEMEKEEIPVMIDEQILDERGILQKREAYLSLSVVNERLNSRFYWDKEAEKLLYSDTEETIEQAADEGETPMVIRRGDTVYVNIRYVGEVSDIEFQLLTEPNRLVIQKTFQDFPAVEAKRTALVRYQGGIKSPVLTKVEKGTVLWLLEEFENWSQVATPDGYVGCIEKKELTKQEPAPAQERKFREAEFSQLAMEEPVNLAWHQVTTADANALLGETAQKIKGVNVISPTWFKLADNEGGVDSIASADYVNQAHGMGMKVWGLVDNFSENVTTAEVLSKQSARTAIIRTLIREAVNCGMDGINIDFESLSEEAGPHFLQFLRELSIETHKMGLVLSVDNPVPEDFTSHYDRKEQGRVADYVIIMGYDEHYVGSEAGSVASLPWVEKGIQDTIAEVPAKKVINGIPFYTRVWKTSAGVVTSEAVGMDTAAEFIKKYNIETYWDKNTSQNYGKADVENDTYEVWLEDEESIAEKMLLVPKYGLAGVAEWKLGFERPSVWKVISEGLNEE